MAHNGLIYDVGAHKGEDTGFYLKKGFQVVAIEASPDLSVALNQKYEAHVKSGQLRVLNVAVAKEAGKVDFFLTHGMTEWNTSNLEWVQRNKVLGATEIRKIQVEARPLADIMREHGVPYYCKIDIEGNDLDALKSLVGVPEAPAHVSIESEKRHWDQLMEEFLTFRALGYTRFKIVDQTLVELQACPSPPREGDACEHVFTRGASGMFGEEAPGAWVSLSEAVEAYRQIFRGYALNGDNGLFKRSPNAVSLFHAFGALQARLSRWRKGVAYANPADILPPAAWYDTHAAR